MAEEKTEKAEKAGKQEEKGKPEERKISRIKTQKKKWFPILSPGFLGQREIGESYLNEAKAAVGRVLGINLRDLTGNVRDQNIHVSLKVKEASGSNLQTEIIGYNYLPFYVRKLARKQAGKIEDSFVVKTKEGKAVRLKPLVTPVFGAKRSAESLMRKKLREMLEEEAGKLSFEGLIDDLLKYRMQMEFRKKLNKICPVRDLIVRVVELASEKDKAKKKKKEKEEELEIKRGEEAGEKEEEKEGKNKEDREKGTGIKEGESKPEEEGKKKESEGREEK